MAQSAVGGSERVPRPADLKITEGDFPGMHRCPVIGTQSSWIDDCSAFLRRQMLETWQFHFCCLELLLWLFLMAAALAPGGPGVRMLASFVLA